LFVVGSTDVIDRPPPEVKTTAVILLPLRGTKVFSERAMSKPAYDDLGVQHVPNPVGLLRSLVRFDTSNPPGNERPCIEFVADLLRSAGVELVIAGRHADRPNLVARVSGRGDSPPLLLLGHVDVVPANPDEWSHPPFGGELVDGEVWGRGTLDMKGGVAMFVTALLRVVHERLEPAGDVILALVSDEEAGSEFGAKYLVEERPELFEGIRYGLSEFGAFTQWTGDTQLYPIQVAEKQRCLVRATMRGPGGHASTPVRGTAAAKVGRLLQSLDKRRLPVHVTPVVRLMVEAMADALPLQRRMALRPLLVPALTDRLLDLLGEDAASLDPLLHNTATPTILRGGESTNVIPTEMTVDLDGRVLPGQTPRDLVRELEELVPGVADYELAREEPAARAEPDLTLFPLLADVIREREPHGTPIPMLLPAYTDARYFSRLGIQTYGFLPMRLPKHITTALVHAPNERIPADAVEFGAECVYEVIRRYRV
jgi:acetylornithine deacetylase/succinyl-diaminopimelate desuccinylase-like protein